MVALASILLGAPACAAAYFIGIAACIGHYKVTQAHLWNDYQNCLDDNGCLTPEERARRPREEELEEPGGGN